METLAVVDAILPRRTPTVKAGTHEVRIVRHAYKQTTRIACMVKNRYGNMCRMSIHKFKFENDIEILLEGK